MLQAFNKTKAIQEYIVIQMTDKKFEKLCKLEEKLKKEIEEKEKILK